MIRLTLLALTILFLSGCTEVQFASHVFKNADGRSSSTGNTTPTQGTFKVGKPYVIQGTTYYPKESYDLVETGIASWYGPGFHGSKTASGEKFDTGELTAAHRTLQMPSMVRVTNLENGRSVIVRVNDRGPFARGRVIDVSSKAADLLGFKGRGTARVKLEVLSQESLHIAELAKRGVNTRGTELAASQGRLTPPAGTTIASSGNYQVASANGIPAGTGVGGPIDGSVLAEPLSAADMPLHQAADGRMMPDPVVTQMPVHPTKLYIQAGSFSVYENAEKLKQTLASLGNASVQQTLVGGRQFYRVRVGPVADVQSADKMLSRVAGMGHNKAIIVVD